MQTAISEFEFEETHEVYQQALYNHGGWAQTAKEFWWQLLYEVTFHCKSSGKLINQSIKQHEDGKKIKERGKECIYFFKETKISISIKTMDSNQTSTGKVWMVVGRKTRASEGKVASVEFKDSLPYRGEFLQD